VVQADVMLHRLKAAYSSEMVEQTKFTRLCKNPKDSHRMHIPYLLT